MHLCNTVLVRLVYYEELKAETCERGDMFIEPLSKQMFEAALKMLGMEGAPR
jgi:hypothetical protein